MAGIDEIISEQYLKNKYAGLRVKIYVDRVIRSHSKLYDLHSTKITWKNTGNIIDMEVARKRIDSWLDPEGGAALPAELVAPLIMALDKPFRYHAISGYEKMLNCTCKKTETEKVDDLSVDIKELHHNLFNKVHSVWNHLLLLLDVDDNQQGLAQLSQDTLLNLKVDLEFALKEMNKLYSKTAAAAIEYG